ncbi:unnamed protein product [Candidula unifasciata]|uniref:Uncharacterized protein n=1 Tax=Candidula unifasciata TaxID=100452 RepID=A0A8S3YHV4_9EUPU|nr:unnamed protein product [Candidula unifasciata]
MLVTPRQDSYSNNLNNNNSMSLSPHHHRHHHYDDDNNSLRSQLTDPAAGKCYSPRPGHKVKQPPHINICPPDESTTSSEQYSRNEELDNDMFQSPPSMVTQPTTSTSIASDEKHEVFSGRLYILRHTGSTSSTSSSPTRSPSRTTAPPSPFRFSPPLSSQQWSPQNSPNSSPTTKNNKKMPVFVKVYRCNLDHFAVITRDALYTSRPVYLNLRHSRVMPGQCLGRFIVAGQCDSGNVIEFETPELATLGQWLDAFHVYTPPGSPNRITGNSGNVGSSNTPPIPRSPALPTLTETDEDD